MKVILLILIITSIQGFSQKNKSDIILTKKNGHYKMEYNGKEYDAKENILTIRPKHSFQSLYKRNLEIVRENKLGFIDVKVPIGKNIEEYAEELKSRGLFDIVEYNSYGEYNSFTPNDPSKNNQWHLSKIKMYNAWDITFGVSCIVVGILDSGIDWEHEDIGSGLDSYQNIFLNPGEDEWSDINDPTTGNGIDDEGNGLIDDWKGWNFVNNSNDSRTSNNHGTFVSGIISAKTNNGRGIAGIAGGNNNAGVKLLSYCIGVTAPDGSILDDAIINAVDNGVKVIQLSLGVPPSSAIDAAIQYAIENEVVIVCCSMNESYSSVSYPASNSNVIAVGATTTSDTRASFSNYGTELDIVAPGVDIYSTTLNNGYAYESGTSFAAPQVSAVAALLLSINNNLTVQEIRNIIENTAQKVGGYSYVITSGHPNGTWNNQTGYGLLNANAAVQSIHPYITGPTTVCTSGAAFTITNPPTVDSIVWSCGPNLAISLGQNPEECTIVRTGNGNTWIRARLVNGCGAVVLEKNIPAIDPPTVSISTYPETPPCLNTEYSFYATASGSCQPYSYKWFVDNKEVGHNSSELQYTFDDDEWYNSQTVPVYCRVYFAGDSVTSPVLYKTIIDCYQPITASISGDATVCLNDEGHWAATVSGGSQNYIYDWYINQDDNLHFLSETLDYYFSASEWSSRPLSIGLRVTDVITNVQAYANPYYSWLSNCGRRSYSVKVAPNPASDYVEITVSEEINPENFLPSSNKNSTGFSSEKNTDTKKPFSEEVLTYTISDNNGKPFLQKKTAEKKLTMPVSGYFPGVYILTVTSSTEKVTQQILISR